jgi:prolyl oligopeptidase PreP (S9A serine peptidase family)
MKNIIIFSIFVLVGCSHLLSKRDPSSATDLFEMTKKKEASPDLVEKYQDQDQREIEGREKPWRFVYGTGFCEKKSIDLRNVEFRQITDSDLETPESPLVQQWVEGANIRTFQALACDDRYKSNLKELVQSAQTPYYMPNLAVKEDSSAYVNGYFVSSYESMAFDEYSYAGISSLVQKPEFENSEREKGKQKPTNAVFRSQAFSEKLGTLEYTASDESNGLCVHSFKNKINGQVVDYLYSYCVDGGGGTTVFIGNDLYLIYSALVGDAKGSSFVLKLHQVKGRLSAQQQKSLTDGQNALTIQQDLTLVTLDPQSLAIPKEETTVPLDMRATFDTESNQLRVVASLLNRGKSEVRVWEIDGNTKKVLKVQILPLSDNTQVSLSSIDKEKVWVTLQSPLNGLSRGAFYFKTRQWSSFEGYKAPQAPAIITRVLFYTGKDGSKLPVRITYPANFKLFDSKNFGVVTTYGGFNEVSKFPGDTRILSPIYNRNGFSAIVLIRGGGDFGVMSWGKTRGVGKQTSIDDLNSAVEFLNQKGFANKKRIASYGYSHGGLMVLMAAEQRPDLYGAVFAGSPVTDVLNLVRTESRGIGQYWFESDYGDPNHDPQVKTFWEQKSPLQNAQRVDGLPPILLRTAYGDPNVNAGHSLKMFKALNDRKDRDRFYLLVQPKGQSHGPINTRTYIEEFSYMYSFFFRMMDIK